VQELESAEREEPRGKGRRYGWDLRCFPAATYQAIFFYWPICQTSQLPHSVEAGESGRSPGTCTDSDEESALGSLEVPCESVPVMNVPWFRN